ASAAAPAAAPRDGLNQLKIILTGVAHADQAPLLAEIGHLGQITGQIQDGDDITLWVSSSCSPDDIIAVCCFVIDAHQIHIEPTAATPATGNDAPAAVQQSSPSAAAGAP